MKTSPRLPLKELTLLVLPILGFGAYVLTKPTPKPEVAELIIKETEVRWMPVFRNQKGKPPIQKRWTKMTISFGYKGDKPDWWGRQQNDNLNIDTRINFTTANQHFSQADKYSHVDYEPTKEIYSFVFQTELPEKQFFLNNANCNISIVAMDQETPRNQLGKVSTSKSLKELMASKRN
jgi:hypothetical protein